MKIAALQTASKLGDIAYNVSRASNLVREAAGQGARLLALPEYFQCGPIIEATIPETFRLAERMDGPTVRQMAALARELEVWLCVPLFEQDGEDPNRYFNAVAVLDPAGQIVARYRKRFIPNRRANEKYFFAPGDLPSPVWRVDDTRFGINICFERQFMETSRIPALKGADVLVHVTATWGDGSGMPNKGWFEQATAMARLNSLWVVAASATRVPGLPGPQGHSLIADPRGDLVATLRDEEGILVGDVDPLVARETRAKTRILSEQRTDVLEELAACNAAAEATRSAGVPPVPDGGLTTPARLSF